MSFRFAWAAYTKKDLVAVDRVRNKAYRRRVYYLNLILYLCWNISFGVFLGIDLLLLGQPESHGFALSHLLLISMATVLINMSRTMRSRVSYDLQDPRRGELTVTLDEAGVVERNALTETHFTYPAFTSAYHCRGRYILFINDSTSAVILPEEALKEGDPAAFRAFLERKLQGPIVEMK